MCLWWNFYLDLCYKCPFQELSAIVPAREKQTIVKTAISKVQKLLGWDCKGCLDVNEVVMDSYYAQILRTSCIFYAFDTFHSVMMQFRAAIQLQFDFHRAIYNLGTVLVALPSDLDNIYFSNMLHWIIISLGNVNRAWSCFISHVCSMD